MGFNGPLLLLCLAVVSFSSSWACTAAPAVDDLMTTSCGVALDVFSQCSSAATGNKLDAACCTPYSVLKTYNCFWCVHISPTLNRYILYCLSAVSCAQPPHCWSTLKDMLGTQVVLHWVSSCRKLGLKYLWKYYSHILSIKPLVR